MAATASGSWAGDSEPNGTWSQQRQRTDTHSSDPRSVPYPGYGARRKTSDYDIRSDTEYTGRRATSRPGNSAASKKRSRNQLRDKQNTGPQPTLDDSAWIHRDKLAQIEIREMEEAGIYIDRPRRAPSTEPEEYGRSESQQEAEYDESQYYDENERKRMSTIHGAEEEEYESRYAPQPVSDQDYDTYEAQQTDDVPVEQTTPRGHQVRPSTSRIPIVKGNTPSSADRDSNAPRSRSGSIDQSGRMRSNSIGGSAVLDQESTQKSDDSPPKSAKGKKKTTSPDKSRTSEGGRPGSSHMNKPGPTGGSVSKRPGSSHGRRPSASRPPPEGDPPWINSMFKPDPRLPPDQQMLPTHAKRMMQEQWAKESKPSTVYDRDFMQLTDEELRNMVPPSVPPKLPLDSSEPLIRNSPKPSPSLEVPATSTLPPSKSPKSSPKLPEPLRLQRSPSPDKTLPDLPPPPRSPEKSDAGSIRPGTSGGYRITPTISTFPSGMLDPSPRGSQRLSAATSVQAAPQSPIQPTPRIPDLDEKDEAAQKKGCCCVMM